MSLSVVIICKNNESTIGRTLASVAGLATEIVALDSGSTDNTIAMLQAEGARVERVEWQGHIATKQRALQAARCDWILSLDSDESLEPDLIASIDAFIARDDAAIAGACINRKVWYADRPLNHTWQPEWRLRLVRKSDVQAGRARWGGLNPHDKLEVIYTAHNQPDDPARAGKPPRIVNLPGTCRHDSFDTMLDHLRGNLNHSNVSSQSLYDIGRRGSYAKLLTSPAGAFAKQMILKGAWRDGWRGWVAAASTAVNAMTKHMLLIEKTHMAEEQKKNT